MDKEQVSIHTAGRMAAVVKEALQTFPDTETPGKALTRVLFDWHNSRKENSTRHSLDRIEQELANQRAMLEQILQRLPSEDDVG